MSSSCKQKGAGLQKMRTTSNLLHTVFRLGLGNKKIELLSQLPSYYGCLCLCFSENEDKKLWDPNFLPPKAVEDYLSKSEESLQTTGVISLPLGSHIRDDEPVRTWFVDAVWCLLSMRSLEGFVIVVKSKQQLKRPTSGGNCLTFGHTGSHPTHSTLSYSNEVCNLLSAPMRFLASL